MAKNNLSFHTYLAVAVVAIASTTVASAQKVAYFASEAVLERFPDAQAARAKLAELQGSWMRDIQRQEQERDKLLDDMQTNRLLWSPQERKESEAKLRDIESKLSAFRNAKFGPAGEFEQKQKELMGPVLDRIQKAIEEVAIAQKYDFIFDKSSRGLPLVYANSAYDVTAFILKRLGVDVDASEMPKEQPDAAKTEDNARRNRLRGDTSPDPNTLLEGKDQSP